MFIEYIPQLVDQILAQVDLHTHVRKQPQIALVFALLMNSCNHLNHLNLDQVFPQKIWSHFNTKSQKDRITTTFMPKIWSFRIEYDLI